MENLIGRRFGSLVVDEVYMKDTLDNQKKRRVCLCKCDCGAVKEINAYSLTAGFSKSCGCGKRKSIDPNVTSRNFPSEYNAWHHAKRRCSDPLDDNYKSYGAKGIKVCARWLEERGFENFLLDMGPKPEPKNNYEIDRIDNQKGYFKENCRWATHEEQSKNRDGIIYIEWEGKTLTLQDWAEEKEIKYATLKTRYYDGKRGKKLFASTRSRREERKIKEIILDCGGERRTINEWSLYTGIDSGTLVRRYDAGWDHNKIVSTPTAERKDAGAIKNAILTYDNKSMTLGQWAEFLGKNYDTLKNRYTSGLPVDKILSDEKFSPGRNNLRKENLHIGERFGSVIVNEVIMKEIGNCKRSYAICNCDCGVENKEILLTNLVTGKQKSCGCGRGGKVNLENDAVSDKKYSMKGIVGKKFDRLTVQEVIKGKTDEGNYVYKLRCLCDCGNETTINLSHLGRVKSCGCMHKETMKERRIDLTKENVANVKNRVEAGFPLWEIVEDSQFLGARPYKLKILEVRRERKVDGTYAQYARCLCDCGNETIKKLSNVTTGHTKSCGCAKVEAANKMSKNNSLEVVGTKFCKVGDVLGDYTVKEIFKRKNNIYALCDVLGKGEKSIRADCLQKKVKMNTSS